MKVPKKGDIDVDTIIILIIVVAFLIVGAIIIAKYTGKTGGILEKITDLFF